MTATFQIDESKNLTIITLTGTISYDKVIRAYDTFFKNPTKNILWDYSQQDESCYLLGSDEFKNLFEYVISKKKTRPEGKTAYIVPNKILLGMAKVIQHLVKAEKLPWEMKVFVSMDQALEWIGK